MKNICFCFQINEPFRLKRYRFFDIGQDHYYYDDFQSESRIEHLVNNSYLPANRTLLDMIRSSKGRFKCSFAISGVALEQIEMYSPELIDSFKELADTGSVEFLAVPYSYSLAAIYDEDELALQLKLHADKIFNLFGKKTTTLCNTEMLYNDDIADLAYRLGYKVIMAEGARQILGWKSPNYVYTTAANEKVKVLLRNPKLSDDIAFRFGDYTWVDYPLDAPKYISWLDSLPQEEQIINLWMGYDALGIRQNAGTGIFDFIKALPYFALDKGIEFITPSEAGKKLAPADKLVTPYPLTWTGENKDLSIFNGNDLQQEALNKLYSVGQRVRLCSDPAIKHDWQLLQTVNHFRFMNHIDAEGTNYESAYDAFINYMNVLSDFMQRVEEQYPTSIDNEELNELLTTINNQEKEIEALEKQLAQKTRRTKKAE